MREESDFLQTPRLINLIKEILSILFIIVFFSTNIINSTQKQPYVFLKVQEAFSKGPH